VERLEFPVRSATGLALLRNFVDTIRGTARPLAPAHEAAAAVEVANAILWSSLLERPLTLPIDGAGFERALSELSSAAREAGRRLG
jgi:hypothetical protein